MARLPRNPAQAVAELGVAPGARVLAIGPAAGFAEALAEAVGEGGSVLVADPPPELEAPSNVEVVEAPAEGSSGDPVLVWLGPVPAHTIREYPALVSDGGALWVVFPRTGREKPNPVHESEVKRALLVTGWNQDKVVPLSTDAFAVRYRKRR